MAAGLVERLKALDDEQRRYTLETLVVRLRDVGQVGRLRILFSDDAWLQGRFEGSDGAYDGYRADLDIAWEAMAAEARKQIEAKGDVSALADCWHNALIRTSLNSIAGNYAPALVARAIQTGDWSAEKALGVIPGITDLDQRVEICVAVLESELASPMARVSAQKLAVDFVSAIEADTARSRWVLRVAPLLDDEHLPALREIAESIEQAEHRAAALAAVAARMAGQAQEELLDAAVATLVTISAPTRRAEATSALAPYLSGERAVLAAHAAGEIASSRQRVQALAALLPSLTDADRQELARHVVEQLWSLDNEELAFLLDSVLTHLPEVLQEGVASKAFERVKDLDDMTPEYDAPRPVAIRGLAPYLNAADVEKALAIVRSMSDGKHLVSLKASVFAALAARMTAARRGPVVAEALRSLEQEDFGPYAVSNLAELIPLLSEAQRHGVVKRALTTAFTLWDEKPNQGLLGEVSPRLTALTELAPFLSGELLAEALGNARVIKDHQGRAETFLALAQRLQGDERRRAMRLAYDAVWTIRNDQMGIFAIEEVFARLDKEVARLAIDHLDGLSPKGYPNDWLKAFIALAPRLDAQALQDACETIARMESAGDRASGYTAVATYGAAADRERYQALVLQSIGEMPAYSEHLIAYAIRDAAVCLDGAPAEAAWNIVAKLERFERSEAMMEIASRLEGGAAEAALPTIRGLENPYHRAVGLWRLSAAIPEPAKTQTRTAAFDTAMGMAEDELDAEKAVIELLPHLEGRQREQAIRAGLARAKYFGDPEMGAGTFLQLADFMSGRQQASALAQALKRAIAVEGASQRAEMLARIFGAMDEKGRASASATVLKIKTLTDRFEVAASLVPFLAEPDVQAIRQHLIDRLFSLREEDRSELLKVLGHPALFSTPTVTDALAARLLHDLEEICWRWNWR